jgi:hypothetical protein
VEWERRSEGRAAVCLNPRDGKEEANNELIGFWLWQRKDDDVLIWVVANEFQIFPLHTGSASIHEVERNQLHSGSASRERWNETTTTTTTPTTNINKKQ